MAENKKLPQILLEKTPWENQTNPIWLSTSFFLHRNLARFNFPSRMNEQQSHQILSTVQQQILKSPLLKNPTFLSISEIPPQNKEFLYEYFLRFEAFENETTAQGFIVDESGLFFAELNFQNHLQLQLTDTSGSWEKTWNDLNQIETEIGSAIGFAFSPKFGYLTAEPDLCGTGLTVCAYLHIPAILQMGQLQETLSKHKEEDVSVSGLSGNLEEMMGDLLLITNRFSLGVTEENIIRSVYGMAMKFMALEKKLRSHLQSENTPLIMDRVSRAFGLLLHSYQLQIKEALNALSLIKLGLNLDWIGGITDAKINALLFQCQRAHLLHCLGHTSPAELQDISHQRAEFLHKNMQNVVLKIENSA